MNVYQISVARGILRGVQACMEELCAFLKAHECSEPTQKAVYSIRESLKLVAESLATETITTKKVKKNAS